VTFGLLGRLTIGLGLGAALLLETSLLGGLVGLRFSQGFTLGSGGALGGQFFFANLAEGDDAGVFGHLRCFTRIGLGLFAILAVIIEVLRVLQIDESLLEGVSGILLGASGSSDLDGILRFGELQRPLGVQTDRMILRPVENILAPLQ